MAQVVYSADAVDDLERLAAYLEGEHPQAAVERIELCVEAVAMLERHPELGRRVERGYRELVISRGRTGYVALYHYDPRGDVVRVLRLRHQGEAGYRS